MAKWPSEGKAGSHDHHDRDQDASRVDQGTWAPEE